MPYITATVLHLCRVHPGMTHTLESSTSVWVQAPDDILLKIFSFLPMKDLLNVTQCCQKWYRVANDDILWKSKVLAILPKQNNVPAFYDHMTWKQVFELLYYHTPTVESELFLDHEDEVWHVNFSRDGSMFATASKDGIVKVIIIYEHW